MEWSTWNAQDATREREEYWESIRRRREKGLIDRMDPERLEERYNGPFVPPRSTTALSVIPLELRSQVIRQLPEDERQRLRGTSRLFMSESVDPRKLLQEVATSIVKSVRNEEGVHLLLPLLDPLKAYDARLYFGKGHKHTFVNFIPRNEDIVFVYDNRDRHPVICTFERYQDGIGVRYHKDKRSGFPILDKLTSELAKHLTVKVTVIE